MVILFRNGGEVMTFADGSPITHAHWENEPSWPSRDLANLRDVATQHLPDIEPAVRGIRATDAELSEADALWLIDWFENSKE